MLARALIRICSVTSTPTWLGRRPSSSDQAPFMSGVVVRLSPFISETPMIPTMVRGPAQAASGAASKSLAMRISSATGFGLAVGLADMIRKLQLRSYPERAALSP